jgi:hypothetical protein
MSTELECSRCGGKAFERVMDVYAVDRASYKEGKLVIEQKTFNVLEDFIRCVGCRLVDADNEEQLQKLFL